MNLSPYLDAVRRGVAAAAALADAATQEVAAKLSTALEPATRLALIQALSDAAGTISAELAPGSVELRMAGDDPEFVVSLPAAAGQPTLLSPTVAEGVADEPEPGDEPQARISLRLPASVKAKVDQMADSDGISTNAWLLRAVMDALTERNRGSWTTRSRRSPEDWPFGPPPIPTPPYPGAQPIVGTSRGVQGWVR